MTCFSDVVICIEEAGCTACGYEGEPSTGQVESSLNRLPHPLVCCSLPHGRGDPLQVTDVVRPRDGAHGAPYPEGVHRKLYHGKEALFRQISTAGKYTPSRRV